MEDDQARWRIRRGSEHVRIKGTTEELGEIVPSPVTSDEPPRSDDNGRRDDERRR